MAKTWQIATAALLLLLAGSVGEAEETDDRPVLRLHVENHSDVPSSVLHSAEVELTHLYKTVGVRVLWSTRPDHSDCLRAQTIHVVLMSSSMEDRLDQRRGRASNVLGSASREALRAYVYWPRIKSHVSRVVVSLGDALGFVMAHEVGHIVLPSAGHSPTGIMQEDYPVHSIYMRRFTPDQAATIRAFALLSNKAAR
jgi:hypothetical protein